MSWTSIRTEQANRSVRRLASQVWATRLGAIGLRSAVFGSIAIIVSGFGHALLHPVRDESPEAAGVVAAIVAHETGNAADIETLRDDLGYQPLTQGGQLLNPSGSCSTPLPIGPKVFEDACRTHDLGYDLLRVAEQNGSRLGAWARFDLDRRLYFDLLAHCRTIRCRTTATAYYTAVTTNSIRQGYKAPTDEPTTPWVGLGLMVIGLAIVTEPRGALRSMARDVAALGWVTLPQSLRSNRGFTARGCSVTNHTTATLDSSHRNTLRGTV